MYYFACPSCHNNECFYRVRREAGAVRSGWGFTLWPGTLASLLLWNYERRPRVQCANCGYVFCRPSMGRSSVATTAMLMLYCVFFAVLFGVLVDYIPEFFATLPGWGYVELTREFVERHATGVAAAGLMCLGVATMLALTIATVGNWRHHRAVKRKFKHEPSAFPKQFKPKPGETPQPKTCPQCAYDLTGNESGTCPECGEKITRNEIESKDSSNVSNS